MEQSLLDASAGTEYVGRRPSSGGRDTKRISQYSLRASFLPLTAQVIVSRQPCDEQLFNLLPIRTTVHRLSTRSARWLIGASLVI